MSLFLDERIEEQIIDPVNDQITFTYPWIIAIPLTTEAVAADDDGIRITNRFGTNYENGEAGWFGMLSTDKIGIHSITSYHNGNGSFRVWNGTCFISYILYSTEELHSEFYSSPKISMIPTPNRDSFKTPDGAMTKFAEAYVQKKLTKIIVFIELLLPAKFFYRPFERNSMFLKHKHCFDFPDNFEDDFRFDFLNKRKDFDFDFSETFQIFYFHILAISKLYALMA
uniref:Uncharacterized protein n=1 Tax=Panagrolaimus superbus TaxID=310955 RepID=A0A914Y1H5_9BILA